jgi:starch synthase (maltosyl-transferring)
MYTAFVRQFGSNSHAHAAPPLPPESLAALDAADWTLIPKSGTFRDLARELDHIIGTLGFRIIQLLPIHPVPTTFARMGRFGSPFAAIDFFNVDRALAEFDRSSTPLEQFGELVDGIHRRGARVFLDLPINHTGWASHLQVHHPEWFARNPDNTFASPGAWGWCGRIFPNWITTTANYGTIWPKSSCSGANAASMASAVMPAI